MVYVKREWKDLIAFGRVIDTVYRPVATMRRTEYGGQGLRFSSKHKLEKRCPDYESMRTIGPSVPRRYVTIRRKGVVVGYAISSKVMP